MPAGPVLTAASTITCGPPHPAGTGQVTIVPTARLTVAGAGVLTKTGTATIAGCTQPVNASGTTAPCADVQVTGGFATRLTVDGAPVLLVGTFAATTVTGLPKPLKYPALANQTLLRAE